MRQRERKGGREGGGKEGWRRKGGREGREGTIERVSKCDCTCIPCIEIEVYPGQGCINYLFEASFATCSGVH